MTVYERVQAQGEWEIQLERGTPRTVRERIEPFSHIVIVRGQHNPRRMSDTAILDGSLYTGVILEQPGRDMKLTGAGLGWWLGDSNNQGAILTTVAYTPAETLSNWVNTLCPAALSVGTVTSPGGTVGGSYQWVTRRQALDGICAAFGVEWRVLPTGALNVATPANLYGSTPTAIAQRHSASSGPAGPSGLVGLEAEIVARADYREYASEVYVQGQGGFGSAGGASPFRDLEGNLATIGRVVDAQNTPPGGETAAATSLVATYSSSAGQRSVEIGVNRFAVTATVPAGGYLYLYDPEFGLYTIGAPIRHDGSAVFPVSTRVLGVRWPIERGMGVFCRYYNDPSSSFRYEDLTPYVVYENPGATLEVV